MNSESFEIIKLQSRLKFIANKFSSDLAMISSFQVSGVLLISIIKDIFPELPIFFIDTGYHFPETLNFVEYIHKKWDLNITYVHPDVARSEFEKKYGAHMYKDNPDLCCKLNKVVPWKSVIENNPKSKWISAIRRDQSETRTKIKLFMNDGNNIRINPLFDWTYKQIWAYTINNNIPYNPLYDDGYTSIGCYPIYCTTKNDDFTQERAGRWNGKLKTECGLHTNITNKEGGK